MQGNDVISKTIHNGRLLKKYGSWMYCDKCGNTVGYLCYTTYQYYKFSFTCTCGNTGFFELGKRIADAYVDERNTLLLNKTRLCCPNDNSPLFSVVEKNVDKYNFEVICKKCLHSFKKELS